jgi:antitoxin (DNA-binding transcriptional repressor) of toxin-antitoxin stability system
MRSGIEVANAREFGNISSMQTVSTREVQSNLLRLLASVEAGEEFVIARDDAPVARLIPFAPKLVGPRPKVGEMISPRFEIPAEALSPMTPEELRDWQG